MYFIDNLGIISREELFKIRKKKVKDQIIAARKVLAQNIEPLEVADIFISSSFKLMKEGLSRRYPELSPKELAKKLQNHLSLKQKIHKMSRRGMDHG